MIVASCVTEGSNVNIAPHPTINSLDAVPKRFNKNPAAKVYVLHAGFIIQPRIVVKVKGTSYVYSWPPYVVCACVCAPRVGMRRTSTYKKVSKEVVVSQAGREWCYKSPE